MAGDTWVNRGHDATPLIADLVKIRVADAAEENVELHVMWSRLTPGNRGWGKRRSRARSGVCLRLGHR